MTSSKFNSKDAPDAPVKPEDTVMAQFKFKMINKDVKLGAMKKDAQSMII